jgi:hypothetical protein
MNTPLKDRQIKCPKCFTIAMRKSVERYPPLGREWFCDHCHLYFGIDELINHWNYDLGDFLFEHPEETIIATSWFDGDSVSVCDEPVWHSKKARDLAYDEVTEMFLGIPAWENEEVDNGYPY